MADNEVEEQVVHARRYKGKAWCDEKVEDESLINSQWAKTTCKECLKKGLIKGRLYLMELLDEINRKEQQMNKKNEVGVKHIDKMVRVSNCGPISLDNPGEKIKYCGYLDGKYVAQWPNGSLALWKYASPAEYYDSLTKQPFDAADYEHIMHLQYKDGRKNEPLQVGFDVWLDKISLHSEHWLLPWNFTFEEAANIFKGYNVRSNEWVELYK